MLPSESGAALALGFSRPLYEGYVYLQVEAQRGFMISLSLHRESRVEITFKLLSSDFIAGHQTETVVGTKAFLPSITVS